MSWADRPGAIPVLGAVSFAESSVFPVPPDPLLMALCLGKPSRSYYFALITSVSSILGGMLGYLIGYFLWAQLGAWFFAHVPGVTEAGFDRVGQAYHTYDFWAVFAAGFSPIPYKLFTLSSGFLQMAFLPFLFASAIGRGMRFFLVAGLIQRGGEKMERKIKQWVDVLGWGLVVLIAIAYFIFR